MDDFGEDEVDAVGLGCSLERFTEWREVLDLIEELTKTTTGEGADGDFRQAEKNYDRFKYVVNQYKEQPHLLDPHLDTILDRIVEIVRGTAVPPLNKHRAFKYMHLITNVRGYKRVLQILPHAAADMEPVLSMLEEQDPTDFDSWETRYCLLLWLSIIVKIPFDMSRLDDTEIEESHTTVQRLVTICKKYIMVGDLCREACSYLASQFFTRTDTKEKQLPEFLTWASKCILNKDLNWKRFGPLSAVAAILKYGKRLDLLPYAENLQRTMLAMDWNKEQYRLSRKFAVKIIQRIGLLYLPNRAVAWRYNRGARTLPSVSELIKGDGVEGGDCKKQMDDAEEEEEDQEVPPALDDIIGELMQGLGDPDITVRWSAAKGIGRVMGRMNKQFGDEVIEVVLDSLSPRGPADSWHGGCLALAEFSKQGLLLPQRLPDVIPLMKQALVYDELQGYSSVGSHIRDAACYVCWTFARAYESSVFKPYVHDVAPSLVIAFCLDREVNIRRAAAAAFQEHIGRQGTFPHGIDILITADYFSVGVRTNAYLNICPFIAQYEEYTKPLIDHLVERKVEHWDVAIRDLSAKALHNLTPHAPVYMLDSVLPTLLQKTRSIDVNARHGAIISIGEIVYALSKQSDLELKTDVIDGIRDLVTNLKSKHLLKGISGELMKIACCKMIHKCSLAKLPFRGQPVVGFWQELLNECLCAKMANIRTVAADALPSVCTEYYQNEGVKDEAKCSEIVNLYVQKLSEDNDITRVGHALALGSLPLFMLEGHVDVVVNSLMKCTLISPETEKWVDSRRHAFKALTAVCCLVGVKNPSPKSSCRAHVLDLVECMNEGLTDYTKDDRGDTGAWVREACMSGIQTILQLVSEEAPDLLTESVVEKAMCRITQQAVERIDRTRALAGTVFSSILHSSPPIPFIPEREALLKLFPDNECKNEINWLSNTDTFPRFTQMLSLPTYTQPILFGLIAAVGGLTESLVKSSSMCLFEYLKSQEKQKVRYICDLICLIYKENINVDRIVIPMLGFLNRLLSSETVSEVLNDAEATFASDIFELTKTVSSRSTDKFKLRGAVDIFCHLIQVKGDVGRKAMGRIQILLCHKFGWLRKATAAQFYEAVMLYEDILFDSAEASERVLSILSETEWAMIPVEEARTHRNKISEALGISIPKLITPPPKT